MANKDITRVIGFPLVSAFEPGLALGKSVSWVAAVVCKKGSIRLPSVRVRRSLGRPHKNTKIDIR